MQSGTISASFEEDKFADFFLETCPEISLFVGSAIISVLFQMMHLSFSVMLFDAFRKDEKDQSGSSFQKIAFGKNILLHAMGSLSTTLNGRDAGCKVGIPLLAVVSLFTVYLGYKTTSSHSYEVR
eukprot:snap_masked-scaffold_2-processed-gene-16.10-mRNA-1 protein AED:1.00 eAED:1.00 QI:0/-1/0/0/-1/1/1/0/124